MLMHTLVAYCEKKECCAKCAFNNYNDTPCDRFYSPCFSPEMFKLLYRDDCESRRKEVI